MLRQIKSVCLAAAIVLATSVGLAAPSQAATYVVNYAACNSVSLNGQVINVPVGDTLQITFTSCNTGQIGLAASSPATFGAIATISSNTFLVDSSTTPMTISGTGPGGSRPPLSNGTYVVYFASPGGGSKNADGSFTVIVGGEGGGGSSSEVVTPPPTFTLTITPPVGVTCRTSGESATAGSWVSLPAANDCTSPAATPNAQLLGWATNPDFPTAIAQRQITNGWGAYEIFDESGRITAVFIPAGGAVFVSAPGSLFPIWRS